MTLTLAGLLALRFPASITAHAEHPSTLLLALAWIGAIYVTLALAVALLFAVSEVIARVHAWQRRPVPIDSSRARCKNRNRVTAEPDPIESYPDAPIGFGFSELAPPIPTIPTMTTTTPLAPIAVLHAPMGCLPVLLNPMTNSRMRIPE